MALRDLSLFKNELAGTERTWAEALLARPSDGSADKFHNGWPAGATDINNCGTHVCVHHISIAQSAVDGADAGFASQMLDIADHSLDTYFGAGYRYPKADDNSTNHGPDGRLDVYLTNLGPDVFGYCSSDDPRAHDDTYPYYDASAFCVVDNNFSQAEFGSAHQPIEYAEVTLAHELFHAVQFSYDYWEDPWIMEATATWAEDQTYDGVNDNRSYLPKSPLTTPSRSLDHLTSDTWQYGDWIYFQYLSQRLPQSAGGMPTIVRDIWRRMDGSANVDNPDALARVSIFAVRDVVTNRGLNFVREYGVFGAKNRHPRSSYSEGATYPFVAPETAYGLSGGTRSTGWRTKTLNHLSTRTVRFVPKSLTASNWKVRISVDLPSTYHGSAAIVQIYLKAGGVSYGYIPLDSQGRGARTLPFSSNAVWGVELTLTNGGTRYSCGSTFDPTYSCYGIPQDDGLSNAYAATAFQG